MPPYPPTSMSMPNLRNRLLLAALSASLAACGLHEFDQARDTEELLSASGFRAKLADTPERREHLETMTQLTLVPHQNEGKQYYIYADATRCRCIFWGTEAERTKYLELALKKGAGEELSATATNEDAPMDWSLWGKGRWWEFR